MPEQLTVYGAPWCPDCQRSKRFLASHRVAYTWVDVDADPSGLAYVEQLQEGGRSIPTIELPDGRLLIEPTDAALAQALGLALAADRALYDLVIVGGGPAGLTAALYGAREGIATVVVDSGGLGGQAGVTERLDNYPGFPDGIGGADLAERFIAQARRYGVELLAAVGVDGLAADGEDVCLTLSTGQQITAHAVILATGSAYRRLGVPGEDDLIGIAVHFCSTCDGPFYRGRRQLLVIGGGNSACEEALFLTQFVEEVVILQRGGDLTASKVLQDKVRAAAGVVVRTGVTVTAFRGGKKLESVEVVAEDGASTVYRPDGVFVFIGLDPTTGFLAGSPVELDPSGFIRTDRMWQTTLPGVFAAGDVRAGSTKQLAAAVGEGVTALLQVRTYLQDHQHLRRVDPDS